MRLQGLLGNRSFVRKHQVPDSVLDNAYDNNGYRRTQNQQQPRPATGRRGRPVKGKGDRLKRHLDSADDEFLTPLVRKVPKPGVTYDPDMLWGDEFLIGHYGPKLVVIEQDTPQSTNERRRSLFRGGGDGGSSSTSSPPLPADPSSSGRAGRATQEAQRQWDALLPSDGEDLPPSLITFSQLDSSHLMFAEGDAPLPTMGRHQTSFSNKKASRHLGTASPSALLPPTRQTINPLPPSPTAHPFVVLSESQMSRSTEPRSRPASPKITPPRPSVQSTATPPPLPAVLSAAVTPSQYLSELDAVGTSSTLPTHTPATAAAAAAAARRSERRPPVGAQAPSEGASGAHVATHGAAAGTSAAGRTLSGGGTTAAGGTSAAGGSTATKAGRKPGLMQVLRGPAPDLGIVASVAEQDVPPASTAKPPAPPLRRVVGRWIGGEGGTAGGTASGIPPPMPHTSSIKAAKKSRLTVAERDTIANKLKSVQDPLLDEWDEDELDSPDLPGSSRSSNNSSSNSNAVSGAPLRVFRFAIDDLRLYKALEEAGLVGRVVSASGLRNADVVLAVRRKRTGKDVSFNEVRNAAQNAKLPLIELPSVSAVRVAAALAPFLGLPPPPPRSASGTAKMYLPPLVSGSNDTARPASAGRPSVPLPIGPFVPAAVASSSGDSSRGPLQDWSEGGGGNDGFEGGDALDLDLLDDRRTFARPPGVSGRAQSKVLLARPITHGRRAVAKKALQRRSRGDFAS